MAHLIVRRRGDYKTLFLITTVANITYDASPSRTTGLGTTDQFVGLLDVSCTRISGAVVSLVAIYASCAAAFPICSYNNRAAEDGNRQAKPVIVDQFACAQVAIRYFLVLIL